MRLFTTLAAAASMAVVSWSPLSAQTTTAPASMPSFDELKAHISYIASDELLGRMTGEEGNNLAAAYIAKHFEKVGLQDPTDGGYFQRFNLIRTFFPETGFMLANGDSLIERGNMVTTNGTGLDGKYALAFVGYGAPDENGNPGYTEADVRGKIVVSIIGDGKASDFRAALPLSTPKRNAAMERGAAGFIEIFEGIDYPFHNLVPQVTRSRYLMEDGNEAAREFPHWYVSAEVAESLKSLAELEVRSPGVEYRNLPVQNVVGVLEGSDPQLKDEYILYMAHYDHIGAGMRPGVSPADTIFNGTRDNAMGTVAVMAAAQVLAEQRPARSSIFLAVTAEEIGLIGSRYYAQNPIIPIEQTVFVHNIDGAGYNDTNIVTVIGLGRTTADADIIAGAAEAGLNAISDPAPEQNLFDRSDNVNFARLGIPAPTFSPGFTAFDAEINKYYHRAEDNPDENFDFAYFEKFVRGYVFASLRISNNPERPRWLDGDKYMEAFKKLYGEE